MFTIVVVGKSTEKKTVKFITRALSSQFSLLYASDEGIVGHAGGAYDFLVYETEHLIPVDCEPSIVIFKSHAIPQKVSGPLGGCYAVVDSDDAEATELARRLGLRVITCGLSSKDTFTFSSFNGDSAVVCLQRSIPFFGRQIEPFELPIAMGPDFDPYLSLVTACILALSGHLHLLHTLR